MQAFERVMKKYQDRVAKPQHVVIKYNYSMEGQKTFLLDHIRANSRVAFETLFAQCENRIHAIFTFLSMLELIQMKYFGILIGGGRNNFIIEWNENRESESSLNPEVEMSAEAEDIVKTRDEPPQLPDTEDGLAQ
jgi:segregation and condensation protein A